MTDFNPQENTMTTAQHELQHSDQPHAHQKADARDHAHKVAAVVGLAETGLREAESERVTRDRLEDGMEVLRTLLTMPWSERTLEVDRVLHTEKGDLDESRVVEYLGLLLHEKCPLTSLEARHAMVRSRAQAAFGDAWAVAQHLHAVADGLMFQEPQHKPQAPSPVHRGELPPASVVPSEPAPAPAELPKRVPGAAGPQPAEPMYPKAPPESPVEQTGVLVERVKDAAAKGELSDSSVRAMQEAGFGQQSAAPSMTPPPAGFSATAIPQQRPARSGDTVRMGAVPVDVNAMDTVLAELTGESESAEPRPFARAAVEPSRSTAGSRSGSGDGDE